VNREQTNPQLAGTRLEEAVELVKDLNLSPKSRTRLGEMRAPLTILYQAFGIRAVSER